VVVVVGSVVVVGAVVVGAVVVGAVVVVAVVLVVAQVFFAGQWGEPGAETAAPTPTVNSAV
jgi:hypothetical protein